MSTQETAKNILLDKTCKTCSSYSDSPWDGAICIRYNTFFPEEGSCWDWSDDPRRQGQTDRNIHFSLLGKVPKDREEYDEIVEKSKRIFEKEKSIF